MNKLKIGAIGNSEDNLYVKKVDGKYFWGLIDYIDESMGVESISKENKWEEIPKSLYDELIKHEEERDKMLEGVYGSYS